MAIKGKPWLLQAIDLNEFFSSQKDGTEPAAGFMQRDVA
jgi:hypothetical protein